MNTTDPMEARQCSATSKQSGKRCRRRPTPGANVCKIHGSASPQAKRTARERLLEAADPAVARLVKLLEAEDETVAIRAAVAVLDRAGFGPRSSLALSAPEEGEGEKLETIVRIIVDPAAEPPASLADLTTEQLRQVRAELAADDPEPKAAVFRTLPKKPEPEPSLAESDSEPPDDDDEEELL